VINRLRSHRLDGVPVHGLLCLLDGFSIVGVFNLFGAREVAVAPKGVDAICGHALSLCQAGVLPNSQSPKPE
jgi:hypothetical protein